MTRLLSLLFLSTALALPVAAQEATAPEATTEAEAQPVEGTEAEAEEEEGEEEEAAAEGEGVLQAAGKYDFGFSGIMARDNRALLAPLTLSAGQPVASGEYTIKSGGYYTIHINADGTQELALSGGDFFRAVWINEVVINDIEIRPMGVHSIEFDDAGSARISFIAIVPGRYTLSIPGSTGETQQAVFNIQ
ncbi:hypothetical protein [Paracoccus zhejiangensis]|uniref:MSP domain-containing protein n=1 Tax=Paracoccus zhejiangensis TaxID=1077935 RepID=A0A2H5F0L4_9RHOB|nr:hypothetical protein [Paracoccus zhejiangensis]AUH65084.1 hypothetical protein CX676_13615 [Paracoccus zhejiangensis]